MPKHFKSCLKDFLLIALPLLLVVLMVHFGGNVGANEAVDNYAGDVSDLPVFEKLKVRDDMNIVFDSPGGRIVDVVMEGKMAEEKETVDFYSSTLPQLGWKKKANEEGEMMAFERGEEQLAMSVEEGEKSFLIKFSIRPKE